MHQFVTRLEDPPQARNLEYDTGRLSVKMVTDADSAQYALFHDQNFVREEMSEVSKLLIDATFRARPQLTGAYQLLLMMGIKLNHVMIFFISKFDYYQERIDSTIW